MRKECLLLNYLDKPARFLIFTMDEFLCLIVPLFLGMFFSWITTGVLVGLGIYWALRSIKSYFKGSNLRQMLYWYLPTPRKQLKIYIPSFVREWT